MSTTLPRTFTGEARLDPGKIATIREAYESALGDEDKAGEVESAAFHEGRREAYEHVLDLLFGEPTEPRLPVTDGLTVRVIADYQLILDSDGYQWMTVALAKAKEAGRILAFEVTGSHRGDFGIQFITFTVDVPTSALAEDYDEARAAATDLLNEIIHDTDVQVRWLSPLILAGGV